MPMQATRTSGGWGRLGRAAARTGVIAALLIGAAAGARAQPSSAPSVKADAPKGEKTIKIVVSIQPVRGLVEPLLVAAGVKSDLQALIPPGASEHGYEIPPSKLAALKEADLVVLVGLGMEPQVQKYLKQHATKGRRVLVLADALKIKSDDAHNHDHAHDHASCDHDHATDPHIWLDPVLVEKAVAEIASALRSTVGDDATRKRIDAAREQVVKRVQDTHAAYQTTLGKATRRTIVVGHDAWGYLARRYQLKTVAIKGLLATEPTPASIAAATKAVKEEGVNVIFAEPQISPAAANRIASATGAKVRLLDPLGDGDWFWMMETNLKEIAGALGVPEAGAPKKAE